MKRFAIVVAGGSGTRMQGALPKQFVELAGKPLLMHTLEKFHLPNIEIILVVHPDYLQFWKDQCISFDCQIPHTLVAGGNSRAESVRNGLTLTDNPSLIAVHDAVRPFISGAFLERLYLEAAIFGTAIPVLPLKDSLRKVSSAGSENVSRDQYRLVQTPQVFKSEILKKAFLHPNFEQFTDEASLVEMDQGGEIHLCPGEERNIKLTVPTDLLFANFLLQHNNEL